MRAGRGGLVRGRGRRRSLARRRCGRDDLRDALAAGIRGGVRDGLYSGMDGYICSVGGSPGVVVGAGGTACKVPSHRTEDGVVL